MPNSNSAVVRLHLTRRRDLAELSRINSNATAQTQPVFRSQSRQSTPAAIESGIRPIESLETRTHLSVSKDAAGFTVVTPSAGDRVIYVSASGNDSGPGTITAPIRSIAKGVGMLRAGSGDQLLLKRGDTFSGSLGFWKKSGRSASSPLVVGSYGTGERPLINTGATYGLSIGAKGGISNVVFSGMKFVSNGTAVADGFQINGKADNLLLEDLEVTKYVNNIVVQKFFGPITNVTVRRCIITNAYSRGGRNSEGLFSEAVNNLTLEENTFDHNGWGGGHPQTVFNHNVYIRATTTGFVARGNIFANGASHGLQARGGGIVENNLFINNSIGLSFGLVHGSPVTPGGVTGSVKDNVFIGTRNIGGMVRGIGLEVGNIKKGGTVISGNIFANGNPTTDQPAISLAVGSANDNFELGVGINDLTVTNNIVYNWSVGLWVSNGMKPGTGPRSLNNLVVSNNQLQKIATPRAIMRSSPAGTFTNNLYSVNVYNKYYNNPGGTRVTLTYADPSRIPGGLAGGSNDGFVALAAGNTEGKWNPTYTANAAISFIKAGFSVKSASAVIKTTVKK